MEPESHQHPIRFYEIDLLRFLAAISVVLFHLSFRGYAADNYSPVPFTELSRITKYGYLGVPLFFMISGYVILLSAQGKTLRQFFVSRVVRLYPAFWAACTLTFIVELVWGTHAGDTHMSPMLHTDISTYLYNMTMLQDFIGVQPVDGVYWSLTVEIAFYLLISLLIAYRLMRRIDVFLIILLTYAVLQGTPKPTAAFTMLLFPANAAYFVAGMLFYVLQQPRGRTLQRWLLLLAAYALAIKSAVDDVDVIAVHYNQHFSGKIVAAIITLFFVLFFLIIFRKINLSRASWLAIPGALTYPLYLIHSNISFIVFHRIGTQYNKYVLLGTTVLLLLVVAYLMHIFIEKRLSKALRAFLYRKPGMAG